jgi:hypothetical protein
MSEQSGVSGSDSSGEKAAESMEQLQTVLLSHSSVGLTEGLQVVATDEEAVDLGDWDGDFFSMMASSPPVALQSNTPAAKPEMDDVDKTIIAGGDFDDSLKDILGAAVGFAKDRGATARAKIAEADNALDRVNGRVADLTAGERALVNLAEKWFGETWRNGVDVIRKIYADISAQAEVDLFKRYGSGGSGKLQEGVMGNSTFAYTAFGAGGAIYLAAKFWDELDPTGKGYCALHEMSHWVNGDVLDVSSGAAGKAGATGVAGASSTDARRNAYSYQFFAEEL